MGFGGTTIYKLELASVEEGSQRHHLYVSNSLDRCHPVTPGDLSNFTADMLQPRGASFSIPHERALAPSVASVEK